MAQQLAHIQESGSIPLQPAIVQQVCRALVSHGVPEEELLDEEDPLELDEDELEEVPQEWV